MMRRLSQAKTPLPKFHSDREAADCFETHSVADIWDQLPKARKARLASRLATRIEERHTRKKSPISLRLTPEQIAAAKRIAAEKAVGYQTQLRIWIAEGIRRERRRG